MKRIKVEWTGTGVEGPGLTVLHFLDSATTNQVRGAVNAFFAVAAVFVPVGTTIRVPNGGDIIDASNGELTGVWGSSGATQHDGDTEGAYAGGVGLRVVWQTGAIRGGRRVRGSTFIVPIGAVCYDVDGTLTTATVDAMQTAASNLAVNSLAVWSRPRPGLPGAEVDVETALAPDKVSWLRSRRT